MRKISVILLTILLTIVAVLVVVLLRFDLYSLLGIQGPVGPLAHKVMNAIDELADSDGNCVVDINELTDFDWDMMVVVDYFCLLSDVNELSQITGLKDKNGIWTRVVFLKDNVVVYEESYRASVEATYKFNLSFVRYKEYRVFTNANAKIPSCRFKPSQYVKNDPDAPYHYSLIL